MADNPGVNSNIDLIVCHERDALASSMIVDTQQKSFIATISLGIRFRRQHLPLVGAAVVYTAAFECGKRVPPRVFALNERPRPGELIACEYW